MFRQFFFFFFARKEVKGYSWSVLIHLEALDHMTAHMDQLLSWWADVLNRQKWIHTQITLYQQVEGKIKERYFKNIFQDM